MKRYGLILAGVFLLVAILFAIDHRLWLVDDREHPDGALLVTAFGDARAENRSEVNVIAVAGGNWLALCLVGAGQNPQETLREFGRRNRVRVASLQRIRSWFYVGSVPKDEMALVFVTASYSIRSRRLPNLTGNPNFKSACALRNDAGLRFR